MNSLLHTDHDERYHLYVAADALYIDGFDVALAGHATSRIVREFPAQPLSVVFKGALFTLRIKRSSEHPIRPLPIFVERPPIPFAVITAIDSGATRRRIIDGLFDVADHSDSHLARVTALCKLADILHMTETPDVRH